jgi:FkbM family methyltransferase
MAGPPKEKGRAGRSWVIDMLERLVRVTRRFAATGQLSSSPTPLIERAFDGKRAFFVQVGSNDGVRGDPLHDLILSNPQWRGLFIEPLPYAFSRLVMNYGMQTGRFLFEQVAISERTEVRPFYFIPPQARNGRDLIDRFDQTASFSREHILSHGEELEPLIIEAKVQCEPLTAVLQRHGIDWVDIFHIDVEGYDYEVLKQIDFDRWHPRLVLYEHCHLSPSDADGAEFLLRSHGFQVINCGLDTLGRR